MCRPIGANLEGAAGEIAGLAFGIHQFDLHFRALSLEKLSLSVRSHDKSRAGTVNYSVGRVLYSRIGHYDPADGPTRLPAHGDARGACRPTLHGRPPATDPIACELGRLTVR